jgi:hypothetical protein
MSTKGCSPRVPFEEVELIPLPILAGLIVGIPGAIKAFDPGPAVHENGATYQKGTVIVYLVVLLALSGHIQSCSAPVECPALCCSRKHPRPCCACLKSTISSFDKSRNFLSSTSKSEDAIVVQALRLL